MESISPISGIKTNNHFLLEMKNIRKRFGGIIALDGVDFNLKSGEVVALVGDNGAGKSTLIKIISGVYQPDYGDIFINGKKTKIYNTFFARKLGIETIFQDLALFGLLGVTTNLFAGREKINKYRFLKKSMMDKISKEVLKKTGITIKSLRQSVDQLSGGQKHAIAIARAVFIAENQKILLMDEPTAGLGVNESNKLLDLIKNLRNIGISIVLITHNFDHAFIVSDRFIILRGGKNIAEKNVNETNTTELVELMVGRSNSRKT